jgi:hypothetical protein
LSPLKVINPSLALQILGSVPETVNEGVLLMVKSRVTVLSHPEVVVSIKVAVLLLELYVFPSIHVYESQDTCVSVPATELLIVRSRVIVLSHP